MTSYQIEHLKAGDLIEKRWQRVIDGDVWDSKFGLIVEQELSKYHRPRFKVMWMSPLLPSKTTLMWHHVWDFADEHFYIVCGQ